MAKFRVNDIVVVNETGQKGVVMCREEVTDKSTKHTNVTYLVKLGEGFENYKQFTRKELSRPTVVSEPNDKETVKIYTVPDKRDIKITLVSLVDKKFVGYYCNDDKVYVKKYNKTFRMGVAICSPGDEYNKEFGINLARHRAKTSPFCSLNARFLGEFNQSTVDVLMDVKAQYLIEHIDEHINK